MPFRRIRPGAAFKNGKLYIFSRSCITVMRPWPDPMAWTKTRHHDWRPCRPEIRVQWDPGPSERFRTLGELMDEEIGDLLSESLPAETEPGCRPAVSRRRAFGLFFERIPEEVKQAMAMFPNRQWHVMSLLARCPGSMDLVRSTPALAYALASSWVFHKPPVKRPMRSARALVRRRQREILGWLGFPPTESACRVMRKVHLPDISVVSLLYLRDAMNRQSAMKALTHLERINAAVIRLVSDQQFFPHVGQKLLMELAHWENRGRLEALVRELRDTLRMADLLNVPRNRFVFNSTLSIREAHDELIERFVWADDLANDAADNVPFPPPPVPGCDQIVPIRNFSELVREGVDQRNCVASYAHGVRQGDVYIYRVLWPERATLSLVREWGDWVIDEIRARCNAPVLQQTVEVVQRWLAGEYVGRDCPGQLTLFGDEEAIKEEYRVLFSESRS